MKYSIIVEDRVEKDMASLHPRAYAAVDKRIRGLSDDPRPPGAALLKGGWKGYWRVRSGDYRVIYEIDDRQRIVTVAYVGPRESIY